MHFEFDVGERLHGAEPLGDPAQGQYGLTCHSDQLPRPAFPGRRGFVGYGYGYGLGVPGRRARGYVRPAAVQAAA
ncbi:hypothetical protein GCM10010505_25950 [Kitasatospora aburaviensis]